MPTLILVLCVLIGVGITDSVMYGLTYLFGWSPFWITITLWVLATLLGIFLGLYIGAKVCIKYYDGVMAYNT